MYSSAASDSSVFGAWRSAAGEALDDGRAHPVWFRHAPYEDWKPVMPTRRALLASAAMAPLLTAGLHTAQTQVETPGEVLEGTPVATPRPVSPRA